MDLRFDIKDFLFKAKTLPVIDVRSPVEYLHAHIPGAVNLPLFSNEERSVIGTLYLRQGSSEATMKGLEFIRPRMKDIELKAFQIAPEGEALMYCWRGGMRSNSMAWLLNTAGIKTSILTGGYKTYRRFVQESFENPLHFVVIGGMTGSGKTLVIESLESLGKQVLHLEKLANHKGSVFGAVGMPEQPSAEQFENDLSAAICNMNPAEPVFIEDESLAIGKVFLPRAFYNQMSSSSFIELVVPVEKRIDNLCASYNTDDTELLTEAVRKIEKRLGYENAALAIDYIVNGEMKKAVEIILRYYDKIYARSMSQHRRKSSRTIHVKDESAWEIAKLVISD